MKYSTIFLDLDNTILDFNKAEDFAIREVLIKHGLPCDDIIVKKYSEINLSFWKRFEKGEIKREEIFENRFVALLEYLGREGNVSQIAKDYFLALSEGHFTVDGAEEILGYLKNKGYKLYVTTNGVSITQYKRIKDSGIEKYIDGIYISEDTGHQKPEKEYFDYIFEKIPEKNKSKILIIGDSQSSDILGGINSGIDTCWFNYTGEIPKYKSNFVISNLKEIENIL